MGYSPGFLLKIGQFRTLANSLEIHTNSPASSCKSICKHAGGVSGSLEQFLAFTKIRHVPWKPWAFCSKSAHFGPFLINQKSTQSVPQVVRNPFASMLEEFGAISGIYQNPPCSKPWAIKALLHCAISSATCNAILKNVFVAVAEVRCYAVQRNLSNLQRFVPRKPGETRYWRARVGGRSDLQRNQRTLGKNCVASCWRGVTLVKGSC